MKLYSNKPVVPASPSSSRRNISISLTPELNSAICDTLHLATMNGHIECMEEILQVMESLDKEQSTQLGGVNAKDKLGMTAAHHAALSGVMSSLALLLERGADIQRNS